MATAGRVPPQDIDAEKSVLGAVLVDPDAIVNVADLISPESFYDPSHQLVYEAMERLYEKRQPIDVVTLTSELKKMKKLKQAGGTAGVAALSNLLSSAANAQHYAKLVADAYVKRRLITMGATVTDAAFDASKDVIDIMDLAEQQVFALSQQQNKKAFLHIKDTLVESFERIDMLQSSGEDIRGVPSGFADLDNTLNGFGKSNLIILAARPGMGKTAFTINMARFMSVVSKKTVGIFSLELSREELVDRLLVDKLLVL